MTRWRKIALGSLVALLLLCVGARAVLGGGDDPQEQLPAAAQQGGGGVPAGGEGFVQGQPGGAGSGGALPIPGGDPSGGGASGVGAAAAAEDTGLESLLPILTEGTFFALIGFALGYASRKIVKVGLIFVAIFFAGLQGLVYAGVADVDWGAAIDLLNDLILNVQEDQTFTQILKAKIPTAGGLIAGYLLGFRRG